MLFFCGCCVVVAVVAFIPLVRREIKHERRFQKALRATELALAVRAGHVVVIDVDSKAV